MSGTPNRRSEPDALLDMGIWSSSGDWVALPKAFFPARNDAKRFAVENCEAAWIDIRVKTTWMKDVAKSAFCDFPYVFSERDDPEAFECWLVR